MHFRNPMGVYTLEISRLVESGYNIFDFDYKFYSEEHRKDFEQAFIDYFMFNEIGTESLGRFKHMLKTTLNTNHEKYLHYYKTKIKSEDLNWWVNKDYKETMTRELTGTYDNISNSSNSSSSSNNSNSNDNQSFNNTTNDTNSNINKFLDTPEGRIDNLDDGYLTNVTKDNGTNTSISNSNSISNNSNISNSKSNGTNTSNNAGNNKDIETYIREEIGNIGVTSSGQLVKSWLEDAYINVDQMIFDDCEDLFMQVY